MKKLLCLVSAVLLGFTSCSKDDNNDSPDKASPVLLKTRIDIDNDGVSYKAQYVYNDNKLVSITDADGSIMKYVYTGDFITKIEQYDNNGKLDLITENSYENGKLAVSVDKNVNAAYYYKTKYTYNTDGTVSYNQLEGNVLTGVEVEYGATGKYTFKDGNPVKLEVFNDDEYSYVYEYDNKNNPFKNVLGLNLLLDDLSVNNVIKETSNTVSGENIYTNIKTYSYKYDVNNYPIERVKTYKSGDSTETEIMQFVY